MHDKCWPIVHRRLDALLLTVAASACGGLNSQGLAGIDGGATGGTPVIFSGGDE